MRTLVLVVTIFVGCGSHDRSTESGGRTAPPLTPQATALVTRAIRGLELSNPDDLVHKMMFGIAETAVDDPACARLFKDYPLTNPSESAAVASKMFTSCHFTCPSAEVFTRVSALRDDEAIATMAGDCDPRHPDPLHGVVLPARDYLVLRNGLELVLDRLEATGTDEAKSDTTRLRALLEKIPHPAPPVVAADAGVDAALDAAPVIDAAAGPNGRISIGAKQALDTTSLTDDAMLAKVQNVYMAGIKRCYRAQLAADPSTRGSMDLAFTVDANGRAIALSATGVPPVDACVAALMQSWRFPTPQASGAPATARFTIQLQLAPE